MKPFEFMIKHDDIYYIYMHVYMYVYIYLRVEIYTMFLARKTFWPTNFVVWDKSEFPLAQVKCDANEFPSSCFFLVFGFE